MTILTAKECQSGSVLLEQNLFAQGRTPAARNVDHSMELRPLRFQGPFPLCSETADVLADCEFKNQPGIYLWVVRQLTGSYRIEYIGETSCFYKRSKDHIKETLCGNYRIPNPDQRRYGIQTLIWRGLLQRDMRDRLHEFLREYEKLAPSVRKYLLTTELFLAPCDCERRVRQRIEGALAKHLCADAQASTLFQSDVRYQPRRASETPIRVLLSADKEIQGLPSCLDA